MRLRAAHGDGSCSPIQTGKHKGKWRVQTVVKDGLGGKRRISRLFSTQKEGKDFLRSLIKDEESALALAVKEVTLGEWFEWLAQNDWPDTLDAKTIAYRRGRFKKYVAKRWGNVPLTKIDPIEVKAFYKKLREDGVGHATRQVLRSDLVRAFNQAVSPYRKVPMIWGNPFRLSIDSPPKRDAVALTPMEAMEALRSENLDDSRRAMLAVFLLGGLRLSEQMALTVRQVNFDKGLIYVDQALLLDEKGVQDVGLPKGDKKRTVVMCAELAGMLRPICACKPQDAYLWPAMSENKPRMKKLVYATWRTIVKDAQLPLAMSPHDGRLSHINWIEKLCPDVSTTTMKEHVGHAAEGVTEVNYTRPISPAQDLLRESLSRLVLASRSKAA
jgi:integrase